MNSVAQATDQPAEIATRANREARRGNLPMVVRLKYGEELGDMEVFHDGVMFHSPSPIPAGKIVELILCGGSILVDAEISECVPLLEATRGYRIRARYLETSEDMRELIAIEVRRALQEA